MPSSPNDDNNNNKKQANLSRIRTNQRLSRARRKEYIASLEARLRQHEERGVQATLEIQLAARRVAEENKKLRELLGKVGVSEAGIRDYLQQHQPQHQQQQQPSHHPRAATATTKPPCNNCKEQTHPHPGERLQEKDRDAEPNECSMAADLISLITGANTNQVRVTLGCAPGRNCDVDEEAIEKTITRLKSSVSS
ncbi:hypothetical protein QBC41DRAFT_158317 [Cercophora samala]|uniref:BZIP domain-containing protein n=1 Tax=Cercophora samala TaxID=330535 RepID=A0AA40D9T2_9PEZI|nr:hypothetical protein QBC41DRAFT_158317 [Cercophora samala]